MKSTFSSFLQKITHQQIGFLACLCILVGLFISRAMMSLGMMMLAGNAIINLQLKENLKSFLRQKHLVLLSGYFLITVVSFLWSSNKEYFFERIQIMLPFLILPFAFHSLKTWHSKWFDILFVLFILLVFGGIGWSLFQYFQHKNEFDTGYGFAHVIPTPFKNDHIRFSLAVVLSIFFCVDIFSRYSSKLIRVLISINILYAIVYLHILSAKTGILVFYVLSFLFLLRLIFLHKYLKTGIGFLLILVAFPFIMFYVSNSFRNKIYYIQYSIHEIKNQHKDPQVSDEGRLISYGYALKSIEQNPWSGVGLGDVRDEMKTRYANDFPGKEITVLLPHNQFLMAGMAIGFAGILYLLFLQVVLFRVCLQKDFLTIAFWCMMFFSMLIEPLYETQYGTCMFLFFLLLLLQRRIKNQ